MTPAISMRAVTKRYKHFQLDRVDLNVPCGTVMGLIGPNGAGKTTALKLLLGLVQPDAGQIEMLGREVRQWPRQVKQQVGFYGEEVGLYAKETIGWHMEFIRSVYPTWDNNYATQLLDRFGLIAGQRTKGLSRGQRTKVLLMLLLARRPQVLVLDEPTSGLDPVARHEVLTELMRVVEDEQRTILFSSHNTQEVEQICDSITFMDRGQIVVAADRDSFLNHWRRIRLRIPENFAEPQLPHSHWENTFRHERVLVTSRFDETLISTLRSSGMVIDAIEQMTLEEIFVSSVMRGREGVTI